VQRREGNQVILVEGIDVESSVADLLSIVRLCPTRKLSHVLTLTLMVLEKEAF
jgi:hypothetical protein